MRDDGAAELINAASINTALAPYRRVGFAVVPQAVPSGLLDRFQTMLERRVEEKIRQWIRDGSITTAVEEPDFQRRFHQAWLAAGCPKLSAAPDDHWFYKYTKQKLLGHPSLVAIARQLLTADGAVPLPSSFYRVSLPHDTGNNVAWHQDAQCLMPAVTGGFVTLWIPLADVNVGGGCLEVSPVGVNQPMYPPTQDADDEYVRMAESDVVGLRDRTEVAMKRGDVLCLGPYTPHRSTPNVSDRTRWSVDVRFVPGPA